MAKTTGARDLKSLLYIFTPRFWGAQIGDFKT